MLKAVLMHARPFGPFFSRRGGATKPGRLIHFAACLVFALGLTAAPAPASAQQIRDLGSTSRGLVSDSGALLAARDVVAQAGIDCDVTSAALRGRTDEGANQYEVACRDGPGLIVAGQTAFNCLALAGQNDRVRRGESAGALVPACRLRANRNPIRHYARMAAGAGLDCRVDDGAAVGLSPAGAAIYEIGCRESLGAWIEESAGGWIVKDCLAVRAQGTACRFTTGSEELAGFRQWLAGSAAGSCAPTRLRGMGRNAAGLDWFEVACAESDPIVVGLNEGRGVATVLSCADAAHIGGGCQAGRRDPDR